MAISNSNAVPDNSPTVGEPHPVEAAGSFDSDVTRVILQLRAALTAVFAALGKPIRGGTDLQRELGLPGTLCWQLHGFVNSLDPVAAANQIPGRQATRRTLAAAADRAVPADVIDRARTAFEQFESFVQHHSGGRAAFSAIIASRAATSADGADDAAGANLKARRDAFRATSHIYGVQTAVIPCCGIIHPGRFPDRYDFVLISGFVGLRVMRPFDKLFVSRHGHQPSTPIPDPQAARPVAEPYDDPHGAQGIPVLRDFSTSPLPRFSSEMGITNDRELYISGQSVGRTGELTFYFAQHWPGAVPRHEDLNFESTISYPAEFVVQDFLLAPGIAPRTPSPLTRVYGGLLHELRRKHREVDRLYVPAQAVFAGVGVESLHTPRIPRYVEMLRDVCTRMGWAPESFDTYRCQMDFPVLHTLCNIHFPPPAPVARE